MKFEIGKYYRAGSECAHFDKGLKIFCVDIKEMQKEILFYSPQEEVWPELLSNLTDTTEWHEPRTFEIAVTIGGNIYDLKYKPEKLQCEIIKVVEVL